MFHGSVRGVTLLCVLLLTATTAVGAAPAPTFDPTQYLKPQHLVNIGTRRMNIYCLGAGSPTVILESGLSTDLQIWREVQGSIARHTRVCAYDRAGMGFSDPAWSARNAESIVTDLHALLRAANIAPPYVLVGHSAGGLYARVFTDRYSKEVVGLVLVDPSMPYQYRQFKAVAPAMTEQGATWLQQDQTCLAEARRGDLTETPASYGRCLANPTDVKDACSVSERMCALMTANIEHRTTLGFNTDRVAEEEAFGDASSAQTVADQRTYGHMPLIVLTGALTFAQLPSLPKDQQAAALREWIAMHDSVAALSSQGVNFVVAGAGHNIELDRPGAVISAVDEVVDQARNQNR